MKTINIIFVLATLLALQTKYTFAVAGIVDCNKQDDFEYLGMLMQTYSPEDIAHAIVECNTGESIAPSPTTQKPRPQERDRTYEDAPVITSTDHCVSITQEPDGETSAVREPNCTHYNKYGSCFDTIRRFSIKNICNQTIWFTWKFDPHEFSSTNRGSSIRPGSTKRIGCHVKTDACTGEFKWSSKLN